MLARTGAAPAGQALAHLSDEPVELAGGTGGPRVPEAVVTAPAEEPVLTNAAPAARPAQLAQVDLPAAQPVADRQEPQVQEAPADGAAANLAVWNSGAAPARSPAPRPPDHRAPRLLRRGRDRVVAPDRDRFARRPSPHPDLQPHQRRHH
jgi:hypothetical protein